MLWRKRASYPGCPTTTGWASRLRSCIKAAGRGITQVLSACLAVLSMIGLGALSSFTFGLVLEAVQRTPASAPPSMFGFSYNHGITIEVRPDSTFSYEESGSVPARLGEDRVFIPERLCAEGRFHTTPGGPSAEITRQRSIDGSTVTWNVTLRWRPGEEFSGIRTVCLRHANSPCNEEFTTRAIRLRKAGSPPAPPRRPI